MSIQNVLKIKLILFLCPLMVSCSSFSLKKNTPAEAYIKDRVMDAGDIGELTFGKVGFGFQLMLGPFPFKPGFYVADGEEIGLKHGYLGISRISESVYLIPLEEISKPRKSYQNREKDFGGKIFSFSSHTYHPSHDSRFGIVIGLLGTFRIVVNPMEILDFFLGFAKLDVSKDDIFSQSYVSRGPEDIIYYAKNIKSYRHELIHILRMQRKNAKDQYWDEKTLHAYLQNNLPEPYIIKLFLKRGISTKAMKPTLSLALRPNRKLSAPMIRLLIKNGADLNYAKNTWKNPLWITATSRNIEQTRLLLSLGADPSPSYYNVRGNHGIAKRWNNFLIAAIYKKYNHLQSSIQAEKQELQNCQKKYKEHPSCNYHQKRTNNWEKKLQEYKKILKLLQVRESGDIIYYAEKLKYYRYYRDELIQILRTPRKNAKDQYWEEQALHAYLQNNIPEPYIIKLFLKRGISAKAMKPTLSLALKHKRKVSTSIIRLLLENDADIDHAKNTWRNLLWQAVHSRNIEQIRILLSINTYLGASYDGVSKESKSFITYLHNKCNHLQSSINPEKENFRNCNKKYGNKFKCTDYRERTDKNQKKLQEYREILKLLQATDVSVR
ncbi:MAG: hypothetical protein AAF518_17725 [Spirochaetota bacterium]